MIDTEAETETVAVDGLSEVQKMLVATTTDRWNRFGHHDRWLVFTYDGQLTWSAPSPTMAIERVVAAYPTTRIVVLKWQKRRERMKITLLDADGVELIRTAYLVSGDNPQVRVTLDVT